MRRGSTASASSTGGGGGASAKAHGLEREGAHERGRERRWVAGDGGGGNEEERERLECLSNCLVGWLNHYPKNDQLAPNLGLGLKLAKYLGGITVLNSIIIGLI